MQHQIRPFWATVLFSVIATIPQTSQGSALMRVDENAGVIQFVSQMNYFGRALTAENAKASTDEISRLWNESHAEVVFRGRKYRTEFVITQTLNQVASASRSNCANNYINVIPMSNPGDRSYYALFGQDGTFYTSDELGASTTAAHEFGHGLGLDHNDFDQRQAPVPGIMFARGTWVRKEFQWDPNAEAGQAGGTVKPHFRRVRAEDIQALQIGNIQLNSKGEGCLGGAHMKTGRIVE
ncbi:MAG: hypothetical protein JST80_05000 [Bdellovibrionales bacterium]|nr:hypothetical protein [Bdellovibrionales bacterium]